MAVYANRFTVETGDVARIVFIDERAKIAGGLPASIETVAAVVMTMDNARSLRDLLRKMLPE